MYTEQTKKTTKKTQKTNKQTKRVEVELPFSRRPRIGATVHLIPPFPLLGVSVRPAPFMGRGVD